MATPLFVKNTFGMEADPVGILAQNYPNYCPNPTYTPQITAGTGKFGGQGLSCNRAPSATFGIGFQREFESFGTIVNTVTAGAAANNQKALFQWSGWIQLNTVVATLAATPILSLAAGTVANTTNLPIMGVLNNTSNGLNLVFPTNYSSFATSPVLVAVQTGLYYFVSIRVTSAVAANTLQTSVVVSGATIRDNLATTLSSNLFSGNIVNRWQEHHSTACTFTLDDASAQEVDGTSSLWPAGFTTGAANLPVAGANDMPLMPPVRSWPRPLISNGSVNQWESSSGPNYQAAASSTEFVQATDSGQVDLYKFDPTTVPALSGIKAVQITETSAKFLSVNPQLKYTAADGATTNFDVVSKNTQRIIAVKEQGSGDAAFTPATLATLEVGNVSL
ncbi:MAG: hypothetical protein ACN6OP_11785 [Pseudomonadales bacterium]